MANIGLGFTLGGAADQRVKKKALELEARDIAFREEQELVQRAQEQIAGWQEVVAKAKAGFQGTSEEFMQQGAPLITTATQNIMQLSAATGIQPPNVDAVLAGVQTKGDELQQEIAGKKAQIEAGVEPDPTATKPKDRFINVPNVGLVDLRGEKPEIAIPAEEAASSSTRYKNVAGVGLVDLEAEGGPQVIIEAPTEPSVQKVVAPILEKLASGKEISAQEQKVLDIYQKATTQDLLLREALAGAGGEEDIPAPKTQEEYDALPKGTRYQHPDDPPGTLRTKK